MIDTTQIQFRYATPIQVRMTDLDQLGHVNNGIQCHYFDCGRIAFFEKVLGRKLDWQTMDMVLVHIELDFCAPIFIHDELICESKILDIGNKSFQMIQQLRDANSLKIKTICRSVLACFDRETYQAKPVSDFYRKCFEESERLGESD